MSNELARYSTESGDEVILTTEVVRNIISNNPQVTDKEITLFVELCKAQRLNPFIKEAHLIKYGNNPATMVVGKDVFTRRAQRNPRFRGYTAGLTILNKDHEIIRRDGSMIAPGEQLLGGWCSVNIEGYSQPMFDEVSFGEYAGTKKDGSLNSQWASKPGTMIRKVAIVHALREAFPEDLSGLYDECEMESAINHPEPITAEPIQTEPVFAESEYCNVANF